MKSKFQILFSIEVLHAFFNTGRWSQVEILPSPETEMLLRQNECTTRLVDNELLVIAKTDNDGKLYHIPDLYSKFSFLLVPQSPGYLNYTNFPFAKLSTPVFRFHNQNANESAGKHFITKWIGNYTSTVSYLPGDFVKAADGKIYESIAKNDSGAGSVVPNDAVAASKKAWVLQGDAQFVSTGDTSEKFLGIEYPLELSKGIFNFQTSVKRKEHAINAYALHPESGLYEKIVLSITLRFDVDADLVQVDLRQLTSGCYRLQANTDTRFIYLTTDKSPDGLPLFIDIFNLPAADPQSFVDAAQKPKRTKFTISFAARRVLWRYKTRTDTINNIQDTDGNFTFKTDGLRKFISEKPIPFSEAAQKTFVAKSGTLNIVSPLPNPQPDRLLEKQEEIYTTESFINF